MVGVNFTAADMTTLGSRMIDRAEAEINKYLSKRYDLTANTFQTSTSVPPLIRQLADMLSEGYMWQSLSRGGAGKESMDRGKDLIKEAKSNLELIAGYHMDLVNTTGSVISDFSNTAYSVLSNTETYTPTFDEDDELSWAVDSDKLQDISDSRD